MLKNNLPQTLDTRIQKDKMRLTVTNIYPAFREKTEPEISARLYQIFKKYGRY